MFTLRNVLLPICLRYVCMGWQLALVTLTKWVGRTDVGTSADYSTSVSTDGVHHFGFYSRTASYHRCILTEEAVLVGWGARAAPDTNGIFGRPLYVGRPVRPSAVAVNEKERLVELAHSFFLKCMKRLYSLSLL